MKMTPDRPHRLLKFRARLSPDIPGSWQMDGDVMGNAPGISGKDHHTVRQNHRLFDTVGHQQGGGTRPGEDTGQPFRHGFAGNFVQGTERLVQQQDLRLMNQSGGDVDALLHPARKLVRIGMEMLTQTEISKEL